MADIRVSKLPTGFEAQWAENNGLFPRGVDVILATPHALVGLPRTTRLDMAEVP
ncbi:MAG: phosphonate C-P lyase system protein PhnH [Pseudomonadota bacterium]